MSIEVGQAVRIIRLNDTRVPRENDIPSPVGLTGQVTEIVEGPYPYQVTLAQVFDDGCGEGHNTLFLAENELEVA